jgi:hypothetical protein
MIKPTYPELFDPAVRQLVYKRALELYGRDNQLIVANEELDELGKEICKVLRGQGDMNNLVDEIADVRIMVEQLEMMFGVREETDKRIIEKTERLIRRMNRDEENMGRCDTCQYRNSCTFPRIHPKVRLKECEDYEEDSCLITL